MKPMKVTILNHSDCLGGASVAALRLLHALRDCGVDARMLVNRLSGTPDPAVRPAGHRLAARAAFLAERLGIFAANGFDRRNLFKVSTASRGIGLAADPWIAGADIIVINWVNQGMLSLDGIACLASLGKPLVWIMHDMWPMTGICHHAAGCERYTTHCSDCPLLGRGASMHDLSFKVFDRKKRLYDLAPMAFVAVSSWLASRASRSALLSGRHVVTIPNPFPSGLFTPDTPLPPGQPGLPEGSPLVTMCAARLDGDDKGLPVAVDALNAAAARRELAAVFCGTLRDPRALDRLEVPYVHLPHISDPATLAAIYARSSVVLSASPYETLGLTLVEGMSCGAIPVAFGGDGRDDVVSHLSDGWLAPRGDAAALAQGIVWALDNPADRRLLHETARRRFDGAVVAGRYISLFHQLLVNSRQ